MYIAVSNREKASNSMNLIPQLQKMMSKSECITSLNEKIKPNNRKSLLQLIKIVSLADKAWKINTSWTAVITYTFWTALPERSAQLKLLILCARWHLGVRKWIRRGLWSPTNSFPTNTELLILMWGELTEAAPASQGNTCFLLIFFNCRQPFPATIIKTIISCTNVSNPGHSGF